MNEKSYRLDYRAEDVSAYWSETYLGLREGTLITPLYVRSVNQDEETGKTSFRVRTEADGIKSYGIDDTRLIVDVAPVGMLDTDVGAFYMGRRGERQWKKGTRLRQYNTYHVSSTHPFPMRELSFSMVKQLFNGGYTEYLSAYEHVLSGFSSVALSPDFAIGNYDCKAKPVLFFHDRPVGVCEESGVNLCEQYKESLSQRLEEQMS